MEAAEVTSKDTSKVKGLLEMIFNGRPKKGTLQSEHEILPFACFTVFHAMKHTQETNHLYYHACQSRISWEEMLSIPPGMGAGLERAPECLHTCSEMGTKPLVPFTHSLPRTEGSGGHSFTGVALFPGSMSDLSQL